MRPLDLIFIAVLDLAIGDPEWFPHPVRGMGRLITLFDNIFKGTKLGGIITVLGTIGITFIIAYMFVNFFGYWAWIYVGYVCISIKDLRVKARDIYSELKRWDISKARKKLSKIVGRDTQELPKEKIITATIESIAEGTNDGIIAPVFYLALGGPLLGIIYKAINTLDSMIGHKHGKYLHFGWFAARLDDAVNYIPARISGLLISIVSGKGFGTMIRDGRKHPSPNSGIPEAAMAGALGIRLGGPSYYDGELVERPYIGEDKREVDSDLIKKALRISLLASFLWIIWIGMAEIFIDMIRI